VLHNIYKYVLNEETDLLQEILIIQILVNSSVLHKVKNETHFKADCEILCLTAVLVMIHVICGVNARNPAAVYQVCKETYSTCKLEENGKRIFLGNVYNYLPQGCKPPDRQIAVATKFCTVVPNICGCSVWK
jgi:hypothetical protein